MNLDKEVRLRYSESLEPENLLALGNEALDQRNYQEAVIRFQKLLLVDPTSKEGRALLTRANALLEKERQDKIKAEVTRTRGLEKKQWEQDAIFLFSQQDWQSSVGAWRKWVQAGGDPKRGDTEIRRCWDKIYAEAEKALGAGEQEKAVQLFQSVGPGFKDAKERAKAMEKKLQENRVAMGKMKYEQGMEAYVAGDFKKAKALFEEALAYHPDDLRAQQALNRIREELRPVSGGARP
ncbi:MAG: tetratricopeptide repeat protein [Elusimicrobia bacterium]|nr:tetratricopeptide repeat protein [Elusimicrobiota bacterium]